MSVIEVFKKQDKYLIFCCFYIPSRTQGCEYECVSVCMLSCSNVPRRVFEFNITISLNEETLIKSNMMKHYDVSTFMKSLFIFCFYSSEPRA